jgi:hypothetical protein
MVVNCGQQVAGIQSARTALHATPSSVAAIQNRLAFIDRP